MNNTFGKLLLLIFSLTLVDCSSHTASEPAPVTPETALQSYLDNQDQNFEWEVINSFSAGDGAVTGYDLILTSQQWREHLWKHQLTVLVPGQVDHNAALLFITGGSIKNGAPNLKGQDDELTQSLAAMAVKNKAVTSIIRQTPNQPLYDGLVEDELISFTLHNYKNDGDHTWPLLFPMVKTAVRSMDAVQEFCAQEVSKNIDQFIVTGASKRGWTTWLTGASDPRVIAIAPMVIDVLNMPVNLEYQIEVWQEYSVQIEDYVKLEIPQQVNTESGNNISTMVDPYSYRQKLTMPKMIFIGTIDEYWPVDAIKHYIDEIPGENYIQYVPNAGHGLGDKKQAFQALSSFVANTLNGFSYPECTWAINTIGDLVTLTSEADAELLTGAYVWSADSEDRDFRDEEWTAVDLSATNLEQVVAEIELPESGYKAFYLDLQYKDPNGDSFVNSTRMFVADSEKVL